jgi:hypothetical protein
VESAVGWFVDHRQVQLRVTVDVADGYPQRVGH